MRAESRYFSRAAPAPGSSDSNSAVEAARSERTSTGSDWFSKYTR